MQKDVAPKEISPLSGSPWLWCEIRQPHLQPEFDSSEGWGVLKPFSVTDPSADFACTWRDKIRLQMRSSHFEWQTAGSELEGKK